MVNIASSMFGLGFLAGMCALAFVLLIFWARR